MKGLPLPVCYHPTTVLVVDDDELFCNSIAYDIQGYSLCRTFSSPLAAIEHLEKSPNNTFVDRCKISSKNDFEDHNLHVAQQIHKEAYDNKRFEQISVALIDYQMPGINGLELCTKIRATLPHAKIVLLTGEADHNVAVKAFNDGLIDQFIKKSERRLSHLLKETVEQLQWQYFGELSKILLDNFIVALHQSVPLYYKRQEFADFFKTFMEQNKFFEFYLLDTISNFMLIDGDGKPSWLMVRSEIELEQETNFARDFHEEHTSPNTTQIMELLNKRHSATLCLSDADNQASIEEWLRFMQPLTTFHLGRDLFYYALVQDNDQYHLDDQQSILGVDHHIAATV